MDKAIRTFTILENESDTKRIKINLVKENGGYTWEDENGNTTPDEGTVYKTVKSACEAVRLMYSSNVWEMRKTW